MAPNGHSSTFAGQLSPGFAAAFEFGSGDVHSDLNWTRQACLPTVACRPARLNSIFLDEGFGTLDEATLDVVAGTLENLATRGDRMVGVITHVPALAERVPVRFSVARDQHTASVVREAR